MQHHNISTHTTKNINIDVYNLFEVKQWCLDLEVTPYDLFIAFKEVGTSAVKIKEYFKKQF
ncbi:MAG: DUF3606 domain-containing protein [Candidatus Delongbacteria bacterium]|jgi:hypothetical protein|nr:DUF3606 domain-containing protein [Candidatus Delongbacteria bacterium]